MSFNVQAAFLDHGAARESTLEDFLPLASRFFPVPDVALDPLVRGGRGGTVGVEVEFARG